MRLPRLLGLVGVTLLALLLGLGLGWGPASAAAPERPALLALTAAGLLWPALAIALISRWRSLGQRDS